MIFSPVAVLLLAASAVQASVLTLQSPKFVVTDALGSQLRAEPFSLVHRTGTPVKLEAKDTLKITFQVVDKEDGKGVQPHQTFIRFFDPSTGEEGIQPIRVTGGGKAKFELNPSKPPLYLPPTSTEPLKVSLIIGTPNYDPITVRLFDLILPASQPAPTHPDEASFHVRPELHHTFRPDQKLPPKAVSLFFAGLTFAPWVVLIGLWSQVTPRLTHLFSPSILPFILSLVAFESLLLTYWVKLRLGEVLLYGAGLGLVTIFTGRQALSSISSLRKD
ncbi:hypothetical protein D9611_010525 [Ephemerocybe angulata]|uniref:Oligosaccharyl transferase delta subunit n=2 Tax=Ephemerocybe angulata TaxID=980116 RepID=A0A8H6II50_9AGAR|nr:hypothetical protein D9611_010525 [Tulosesus angulatus]KAF6764221.1 oligosaccharyl transferase delta subunit [Tulosesus angulatus]